MNDMPSSASWAHRGAHTRFARTRQAFQEFCTSPCPAGMRQLFPVLPDNVYPVDTQGNLIEALNHACDQLSQLTDSFFPVRPVPEALRCHLHMLTEAAQRVADEAPLREQDAKTLSKATLILDAAAQFYCYLHEDITKATVPLLKAMAPSLPSGEDAGHDLSNVVSIARGQAATPPEEPAVVHAKLRLAAVTCAHYKSIVASLHQLSRNLKATASCAQEEHAAYRSTGPFSVV